MPRTSRAEVGSAIDSGISRLTRDMRFAAATLSDAEARFLVDAYYIMQEDRKRNFNQSRALGESAEPNSVILWLAEQSKTLESQIKGALDVYTFKHVMGSWMREVYGIGPVLSAGLLAHIDIEKAPTSGHIWSFAGLVEDTTWLGGAEAKKIVNALIDGGPLTTEGLIAIASKMECSPKWLARRVYSIKKEESCPYRGVENKLSNEAYVRLTLDGIHFTKEDIVKAVSKRPWNGEFKTLCWKVGQSFMKFSNVKECYYGQIYKTFKARELAKNESGQNKENALKRQSTVGQTTEAYGYYSRGVLPPAQVDARARRKTVKLFLAHLHDEWYRRHFKKEPPLPYPIQYLGHVHVIPPQRVRDPGE